MFGGTKPTFGATATGTGFGAFNNTTTSSPFGQSAFGKPAASAFGAAPTFGAQQTAPSMFGSNAAQPQTSGLFGGASTSTAFGTTTTAQPAFGNFSQPQQNTSIFGAAQAQPNSSSLFGQPSSTSTFGSAVKPGGLGTFGQTAAQPSTSLFGQPAASTSTGGFGTFGQAAPTTSVFGSTAPSAFGQPANAAAAANPGSSIVKYQPTIGTDTLMKGGQANSINTKQHCITAMKEYEGKSLEELRMEDYLANRKGPQAGAAGGFGGFGSAAQPSTGPVLFGSTSQPSTGLFGQSATGATENKGLFGSSNSAFGQPATGGFGATANQPFGAKPFGSTNTTGFGATGTDASNPFGAKPTFGQTAAPSLFGQTPATSAAPAFGQTTTGFGTGFGATAGQQQQPSLFGQPAADANKPAFGLGQTSTGNAGFGGFGTTATSTATGGLFGAKPTTGFGAAPAFGTTTQANTGFQNFSLNNTSVGGGGLFNSNLNKPASSGFGAFGTNTSTAAPLNLIGVGGQSSLIGNQSMKPGCMFSSLNGTTANTGGGPLFMGQLGQNAFGLNNQTRGFGQTTGDGTTNTLGGLPGTPQQQYMIPIHQQILSKVTSPYGDNPIFKDLKRGDENDPTKATNPAAQKAIMETTGNSSQQFKISSNSSPSIIKVKPIGSAITKKSLFDGLEEFDASVESFSLKPNAKRLILKPKNNTPGGVGSGQQTTGSGSNSNTPQRRSIALTPSNPNSNNQEDTHNEVFSGGIRTDSSSLQSSVVVTNAVSSNTNSQPSSSLDASRRESWLHPNNLEKVRQQNLNAGMETTGVHNSTLNELVPRKPLDTYRNSPGTGRLSVSTVPENPFEEQNSTLSRRETSTTVNESIVSSNRSYGVDEKSILIEDDQAEYEEHPTGIILRRVGYYTIPSMDDLKSFLAEDGSCVVPNFTVGREGYGNVYFGKEMDVAGLNLDEIVHFRNKEIIIYPDDDNKPPIGHGLNREAQVTLDQVWPLDKAKHEAVKDPQRLLEMDWEGKLRRVCEKNETRFIEYRPETGSWVFKVKHFSKYGLNDSDEDDDVPTDPKKAKMSTSAADVAKQKAITQASAAGVISAHDNGSLKALQNAQKISEDADRSVDPKSMTATGFYPMDESAEFMLMDKTQFFQNSGNKDFTMFANPQQVFKQSLTSPTISLANDMGTDAQKLQLMKASFFNDDDYDNKSEASEFGHHYSNHNKPAGIFGKRLQEMYGSSNLMWKATDSPDAGGLGGNLSEVSSQNGLNGMPPLDACVTGLDSFKNQQQHMETDKCKDADKLPPLIVKPKVAAIKSVNSIAPFGKSVAYPLREKWAADLGLYYSRRFKLGFGPQISLIVPTTRNNLNREIKSKNLLDVAPVIFKSRSANDYSSTVLQHLKISATQSYEDLKQSIVDHLQIQLRHSQHQDVEGSECPFIKSDCGTELIVNHLDEAIKLINVGPLEEYAVSVWSLCLALWGDHDELEGRESTSHFVVMYRRNLLSEWLENTLTDKDLLTKTVSKQTYLDHLLNLVMCHKVTEACELAFSYDDANLSLLMAQLSSSPVVRQLMEDQLAAWNAEKADCFIKVERLKLFMLVAGISLMTSSHGVINCLEGLEWLKVLGLQLWYLCSATSSITDALLAYEKSFQSEEFYSLPPTPVYVEDVTHYNAKHTIYDLRYHLLQLFSKRSHPLESLLNPATHTCDPMDYRLSWLLLQTLEALGYRHCSELSESQLHVGFAAQLENNDMWEWAIFVLLHIKQKHQRELAVQNVLYRYVSVSKDVALNEKEKFVINNLGVPEKWIDYAKAVKAGSMHSYHLQAKYLLKAKQWSLAHEIIFQHIAPDAVINDNLDYLHHLLMQFENPELNKSIKVPNWSNRGQIFLDFIDINEKFKGLKSLKTEADIEARWKNLKPQLADLCSRINLLPCPTPKHRLCQSEIAQNLACLVRGVLLVCPILNPCVVIKIALERLPLPQEFAQQELRTLLDTLVGDLSKAQLSNTESITTK